MAVFRVEKTKNYTSISNYHLKDKRLTLKAKGLLTYMLSLPEDWDYSAAGLVAICKEGEGAVKSALKELKEYGYLTIEKLSPKDAKSGRFEYVYNIFEQPYDIVENFVENKETPVKQEGKKQDLEIQALEKQGVENCGQLNTKNKITKKQNTYNKNNSNCGKVGSFTPPPPKPCPNCGRRTWYTPQLAAYLCDDCGTRF